MFDSIRYLFGRTILNPCPILRSLYYTYLRTNTKRIRKRSALLSTSYAVFDINKTAIIHLKAISTIGYKRYKGSRLETSIVMGKNSLLELGSEEGGLLMFHGCDIQVFDNAKLSIGKCSMNRGAQIICQEEITVGDGCLISRGVVIRDNDGGHEILTDGYKKTLPVHIGNHVWIGQNAMIMKGVTIGDGAIIGAGAFVATDVKPNSLVMPDPSRTFAKNIEWKS